MRNIKIIVLLLIFLDAANFSPLAAAKKDSISTKQDSVIDKWESMVNENFHATNDITDDTLTDYKDSNIDSLVENSIHDSVLSRKFDSLNAITPIALTYNEEIKKYVQLYLMDRKELTSGVLGRKEFYFDKFEQELDKYNLPLELKYLSIIESALKQEARSWAGASGLWQFMVGTARMYDLDVGMYVDERYDMYKATEAACQHLSDLYERYDDWLLALAAYNAGIGNVNRAIRSSGGKMDFWKIKPFLPRETQAYVPSFIAVNYVFKFAHKHHIKPELTKHHFLDADTVVVNNKIRFKQIAEVLDIEEEKIRKLNPGFRKGIVPASEKNKYNVYLPKEKINDFIAAEDTIYDYKTKAERRREKRLQEKYGPVVQGEHMVKKGQSLGYIANRYGCEMSDIKKWNDLNSDLIYPGQKLVIYAAENVLKGKMKPNQQKEKVLNSGHNDNYVYHTIRKGDTLSEIAEQYPRVSVRKIKRLNNISNSRRLQLGKKIRISKNAG